MTDADRTRAPFVPGGYVPPPRQYILGPDEPLTLQRVHAPAGRPTKRGRAPLLVAVTAIVIALLAGGGMIAYAVGTHSGADKPTLPTATQVECVNIERAYNAWNGLHLPKTSADVTGLPEVTMKTLVNDGEDFWKATTGYDDKPSKRLAVTVGEYNFALGFVDLELTVTGKIEPGEKPDQVIAAASKVHKAYQAFRSQTCS